MDIFCTVSYGQGPGKCARSFTPAVGRLALGLCTRRSVFTLHSIYAATRLDKAALSLISFHSTCVFPLESTGRDVYLLWRADERLVTLWTSMPNADSIEVNRITCTHGTCVYLAYSEIKCPNTRPRRYALSLGYRVFSSLSKSTHTQPKRSVKPAAHSLDIEVST